MCILGQGERKVALALPFPTKSIPVYWERACDSKVWQPGIQLSMQKSRSSSTLVSTDPQPEKKNPTLLTHRKHLEKYVLSVRQFWVFKAQERALIPWMTS